MQGLLNEASAAFRAGRLDDAEAMLEDALARSPQIPGAHDVLARIALSRGRRRPVCCSDFSMTHRSTRSV